MILLIVGNVNGQGRVGFKRDNSGNLVAVIDFPFMVFEKAPWYENSAFQVPLIIASLVIIVLTVILWPVMALIRRHYVRPLELSVQQWRVRLLVRLSCVLIIIFLSTYAVFFTMAEKDIGLLSPHGNPWLRLIQIAGWLGILGIVAALYSAWDSWRLKRWWMTRLVDTLILLAYVGVIWFTFTWNLLHWSLRY